MRTLALLLALAAVTLTLPACDSAADLQIGGSYTATLTEGGAPILYTLVIPTTEDGGSFSFTLTVASNPSDGGGSFPGNGTYTHPTVRMTPDGASTATGTVTDDGDTLTVVADGDTLVFRR